MATIISLIGPVIGLVSSFLGAGPVGWIVSGVGILGAVIGGIFLYNKFKAWQFNAADNAGNQQENVDHGHVITDNQHQSNDDTISFNQSQSDKEKAEAALNKPGGST